MPTWHHDLASGKLKIFTILYVAAVTVCEHLCVQNQAVPITVLSSLA